jgi:hypothetical protein
MTDVTEASRFRIVLLIFGCGEVMPSALTSAST